MINIYNERNHIVINIFGLKLKFKGSKNNNVYCYDISGNNNKIYLKEGNSLKPLSPLDKIKGLDITISGSDNLVIIGLPNDNIQGCKLIINGDDNKFELGKSKYRIANTLFSMQVYGNNREIKIGEDLYIDGNVQLYCEENHSKVIIGNDCMLSHNLFIRNSDGHVILDNQTKTKILNKAQDMIIGNHVWICAYSKLFKNVKIPDNSIVGAGSIVTSKFDTPSVVLAGTPAKVVKKDIYWVRDNMNNYLYKKEKEHA